MIINKKKSLGLDISADYISYSIVAQEKNSIKIIAADKARTPSGSVKDGNITDPVALAKAIKGLIGRRNYRQYKTTVSLTVSPSLAQIIDLPEEIPSNVSNFIHSEIRHSVFLTGKDIQMDYCRLGLSTALPVRVFVSAIEKNKINPLLKTLRLAGIKPETIELPIIAWIRSVYQKHVKPKFKSNVILVLVRDNVLNLCVFRNTSLDFIRKIDMSGLSEEDYLKKCHSQINSVVQYYDIEFGLSDEITWDCVMELPPVEDYKETQASLSKTLGMNVHLCSPDSLLSDTLADSNNKDLSLTLTSVGLALNPLKVPSPNIKTNLIPDEIKEMQAAKHELLVFANAVAGILLAIFVFAGFAASQFTRTQEIVRARKAKTPLKRVDRLVQRQKQVDEELASLARKNEFVNKVLEKCIYVDWSAVLQEVRECVPVTLYITRIDTHGDFELEIKGKALSPESVNLFSAHLDKSDLFASSSVKEIKKAAAKDGVIDYTVKCIVADNRRLYAEAN